MIDQKEVADKAREHSRNVFSLYFPSNWQLTKEGFMLRSKNDFQAGYEACLRDLNIQYTKAEEAVTPSIETLRQKYLLKEEVVNENGKTQIYVNGQIIGSQG